MPPARWISHTRSSGRPAQKFIEWLPTVQRVRERIVYVEQKTTVRSLGNAADELTVGQLVAARLQIVHARFHGQRRPLSASWRSRTRCHRCDALDRLARRQEEAGRKFGCLIETEMIADPGRLKVGAGVAEEIELRGFGTHGTTDRCANAVHELLPGRDRRCAIISCLTE